MATFPLLKTGAVTQYPSARKLRFRNESVRFLDGTEQRYRDSAAPLRQWEIALTQLDETEVAAIRRFFDDSQGAFGSFSFTDPCDGTTYPNCSLQTDSLPIAAAGEMNGSAALIVIQNAG